jgi:WD40 repeat protein
MKPPKGCVMQWKVNHDYITDFTCNNDGTHLLTTSADGKLSVFDVRFIHRKHTPRSVILPEVDLNTNTQTPQSKVNTWEKSGYAQSDNQDDELLALCLLKNSTKVCVSSQQGILSLFSYNTWGDISDRFPGHPQSIDALLKIDEDTVLTGSSDGLVRAVQLLPNALLGVLGSHEGFPVEALGWSAGRKMVGSLSHDEYIRLWDGSFLKDGDDDEDGIEEDESDKKKDDSDEWEDLDEDEDMDDEDSDDSDDSDDEGAKPKKRPNMFKSANEEFFQDL